MTQPGAGARAKRFKRNSFSRTVTLIKTNDEHTSFSDMRNIKTKSVIEFSSCMTQDNVRDKIQETFPYLENKSFLCAVSKKVNNERKEFDFGGSLIWDGETIREKINGNSNLYILEDRSQLSDSGIEASDGLRVDDDSSETDLEPAFTVLPAPSDLSNDAQLVIPDTASKQDLPLEVNPPTSSQIFDTGMQISARKETSSCGTADDIPALLSDLFEKIQGICPSFGSVKGGFEFNISLTEALPDEVTEGVAHFERVPVTVDKINPFTLSGIVPGSQTPGLVTVTVITDSGQDLGFTVFEYVDDMEDLLKQLVKDRLLQARYFAMLSTEFAFGNVTSGSNISQVQGLENVTDHDSSNLSKQQQSVKCLQLMVYKAAQTNAQEFMEMVFSTSAGQVVFNSYKDRTPLPEDIARANGHDELAQYLQDVYTRLSQDKNVCSRAIDWLELVEAVQKQSSATDESTVRVDQSDEDDAGSSDYTADVETSSCTSFDSDLSCPKVSEYKATTQDESPVGLDESDEGDNDSSDYVADAETSSCGSSNDDTRCLEISENKVLKTANPVAKADEQQPMAELQSHLNSMLAQEETETLVEKMDRRSLDNSANSNVVAKLMKTEGNVSTIQENMTAEPARDPTQERMDWGFSSPFLDEKRNARSPNYSSDEDFDEEENQNSLRYLSSSSDVDSEKKDYHPPSNSTCTSDDSDEVVGNLKRRRMDKNKHANRKKVRYPSSPSDVDSEKKDYHPPRSYVKINWYMVSFRDYRMISTRSCESSGKETIHNFVKRIFRMPGNRRFKPHLEKMVFINASGHWINVGLPVGVLSTEETYQCCFKRNLNFNPSDLCRHYAVDEYSSDWNLSYFLVLCSAGKIAPGVSQFSKIASTNTKIKVDFFNDETIFEALVRDNRFKEEKLRSCGVTFDRTRIPLSCKAVHIQGKDVEIVSLNEKDRKLPESVSLRPHPKPTVTAASIKPNQIKQENASATCSTSYLTPWPVDSSILVTARPSISKTRDNSALLVENNFRKSFKPFNLGKMQPN